VAAIVDLPHQPGAGAIVLLEGEIVAGMLPFDYPFIADLDEQQSRSFKRAALRGALPLPVEAPVTG
jgi:hypothetical protein